MKQLTAGTFGTMLIAMTITYNLNIIIAWYGYVVCHVHVLPFLFCNIIWWLICQFSTIPIIWTSEIMNDEYTMTVTTIYGGATAAAPSLINNSQSA